MKAKYKFLQEEPKEISNKDDKFYYFSDGSVVPIEKFDTMFELVNDTNDANPMNERMQNEQVYAGKNSQQTEEELDPNEFFKSGLQTTSQILHKETRDLDPNQINEISTKTNENKTDDDVILEMSETKIPVSEISPEARAMLENPNIPNQKNQNTQKPNDDFDITGMNNSKPKPDYIQPDATHNQTNSVKNTTQKVDPEVELFRKIKKSKKINIKISHPTQMPTLDMMRILDENFENGIIPHLTDVIANEILSNPKELKSIIKEQLENLVYPKRKNKKTNASRNTSKKTSKTAKPKAKSRRSGNKEIESSQEEGVGTKGEHIQSK